MAKFNIFKRQVKPTVNHEGDRAYTLTPEMDLYNIAAASFMENRFYEKDDRQLKRLRALLPKVEPGFVCKLAVYARNQMHLRSMPVVLLVELVKYLDKSGNKDQGDRQMIAPAVYNVIQRADEITEMLAFYQLSNHRRGVKKLNKLAGQVKRGVARAFNKFDEYQFAKYNRQGEVKLKDALFLAHPKPKNEEQQMIFDKIVNGTLETPYTWETKLSAKGNKKEVWMELIDSKRLGYMAMLRNLRNMVSVGVPYEYLEKVAEFIADKHRVRKSRQLPFRFVAAYQELENMARSAVFVDALEKAVAHSIDNIEFLMGNENRVLIASDVSGSMWQLLSARSKVMYYDVGLVLSMLMRNKIGKRVTTGIFGSLWKVKQMPRGNVLANVARLKQMDGEVGYATEGHLVIEWALKHKHQFDKIVFFTDCQIYSFEKNGRFEKAWKAYKKIFPGAKMVIFNLAGYGSTPVKVNEHDVFMISGWSDRVFDMLSALENSRGVVEEIKKTEVEYLGN